MLVSNWRPHGLTPPETHIFAVGDVHGQSQALEALLDHLHLQPRPETLKTSEIIFLGDLIDRGPASFASLDMAWTATGFDRCSILPGNHELMMLDTFDSPISWRLWVQNGGWSVLQEIDPYETLSLEKALDAVRDRLPNGFEALMRSGPTHLRRGGFLFVHAGISPRFSLDETFAMPRLGVNDGPVPDALHWAWIRDGFLDVVTPDAWPDGVQCVVHGHTMTTTQPIRDFATALSDMDRLATHGRICLDVGAAAIPQVSALEIAGQFYRLHVFPSR